MAPFRSFVELKRFSWELFCLGIYFATQVIWVRRLVIWNLIAIELFFKRIKYSAGAHFMLEVIEHLVFL